MKYFTLVVAFFCITFSFSQGHTVKGTIVAFKKYQLNNVKVTAKKAKTEVFSDSLGNFSITCAKKDHLVFDAGGFENQRFKIKGEDSLKVNLILIQEDVAYKDVVKGKHMTQGNLDYCLKYLIEDNNNFEQLTSIYDVIQYVYPQAKISDPDTGDVDPDDNNTLGKQIILDSRGVKSFNASQYALLVVDGIIRNDISGISPNEVKSVKVLLGNEAAHWGMRGGNGVIEIALKYE